LFIQAVRGLRRLRAPGTAIIRLTVCMLLGAQVTMTRSANTVD